MGREEEQNLMGRSDRRLREDCGDCSASHDRLRPSSLPRGLRSCFRPVLPRLQPEAIPCEGLKPRADRDAVQD